MREPAVVANEVLLGAHRLATAHAWPKLAAQFAVTKDDELGLDAVHQRALEGRAARLAVGACGQVHDGSCQRRFPDPARVGIKLEGQSGDAGATAKGAGADGAALVGQRTCITRPCIRVKLCGRYNRPPALRARERPAMQRHPLGADASSAASIAPRQRRSLRNRSTAAISGLPRDSGAWETGHRRRNRAAKAGC